jgi:hypothetical protein
MSVERREDGRSQANLDNEEPWLASFWTHP